MSVRIKLIAALGFVNLSLVLSLPSSAADHLMVIGAGGEPETQDTIFDGAIKNIGDYVKRSPGLKVDVALNGGHPVTETLIAASFPNASSKSGFGESDYKRLLESYVQKLKSNELLSGDQLMIYIDSHGAEKEDKFKSHRIATSGARATDLNTLAGASLVSLDQLSELKVLAKAKGVKMAIIDASCHSGNSLSLADDNTCVISGTGPNHYGYGTFSKNFVASMQKGKSLEEVFLEARAMDTTPGLPMISTQSGLAVTSVIYEKITPFLYHFDNTNDKLSPFLKENSGAYGQCVAEGNYKALVKTINSIEELNTVTKKSLFGTSVVKEVDLTDLKAHLARYKNAMDLVKSKMIELGSDRLKTEENFKAKGAVGNWTTAWEQKYTWAELITSDYNKLLSNLQERINAETDEAKLTTYAATKSLYLQAQAKKAELLRTQPDLAGIPAKEVEIKKLIESNYWTTSAIATEERKLYSALYKNSQKSEPNDTRNPCKEFKI